MPILNLKISLPEGDAKLKLIANQLTSITERILKKKPEVTAITILAVTGENWFINKTSLKELNKNSFYLDIKVTDGTNSKDEKSQFVKAVFHFMDSILENLHTESYVYVEEVKADAYGFGSFTQEYRYIVSQNK
jgi:4-oxalocrotonate tautomerase